MNCARCYTEVLPSLCNTEELNLHYLGLSICANCRICVYLKIRNENWKKVDSVSTEMNTRRNGWKVIEGPEELVEFYILSQVFCNQTEGEEDNAFFDLPDENDTVKILWQDGNAIGFYTVKRKASIVFDTMESYGMTTLDTAYIRKPHRRKGYGLSILEDLVKTFPEEDIAISTPISKAMYHVILKFLLKNPCYRTKLWEISGVGSEGNRKLIHFTLKELFKK